MRGLGSNPRKFSDSSVRSCNVQYVTSTQYFFQLHVIAFIPWAAKESDLEKEQRKLAI